MHPDHSGLPVTSYPRVEVKPPRGSIGEYVAAVVFVAVIAAILIVPNVLGRKSGGSKNTNVNNLFTLQRAIDNFRADCGRVPTNAEGFGPLMVAPKGIHGWQGPYFPSAPPLDTWGRPYLYRTPGLNGKTGFMIGTYGADGKPGGVDSDRDQWVGSD